MESAEDGINKLFSLMDDLLKELKEKEESGSDMDDMRSDLQGIKITNLCVRNKSGSF